MQKIKSVSTLSNELVLNYFNGTYSIVLNGDLKSWNNEYTFINILFDRYLKDIL